MPQAPIVLQSGAIARLPIELRRRFSIRTNKFVGGQRQSFSDFADPERRYRINLDLMKGSERADWAKFFIDRKGGFESFTFVSPTENLLTFSEQFENAAWVKGSNLVVGKNYLTRSEEFDNAVWIVAGSPSAPTVTADATVAPDGTTTAEQIDFPATGGGQSNSIIQGVFSDVPDPTGQTFVYSVFLRADSSISIIIRITDGVTDSDLTANLTTSWQRFEVTKTTSGSGTALNVLIRQAASQAAKTVFAWGAQLEYGSAASDYTKTVATATELLIADPFWQQAPSGATGASFGLNSLHVKKARQIVVLATTPNDFIFQDALITPGGSGFSRTKGLPLALSAYFKRQDSSPPNFNFELNDDADNETTLKTVTPGAAWTRETITKQFSSSNNAAETRCEAISFSAVGTFYMFGWQLQSGLSVSDYMGETLGKSGVLTARFAEDEMRELTSINDVYNLSSLDVVEILSGT